VSDSTPKEIVAEQKSVPAPTEVPVVVPAVQQQLTPQHQIEPEP
jgi:hypothetical protein